jgi:hypothetical protein
MPGPAQPRCPRHMKITMPWRLAHLASIVVNVFIPFAQTKTQYGLLVKSIRFASLIWQWSGAESSSPAAAGFWETRWPPRAAPRGMRSLCSRATRASDRTRSGKWRGTRGRWATGSNGLKGLRRSSTSPAVRWTAAIRPKTGGPFLPHAWMPPACWARPSPNAPGRPACGSMPVQPTFTGKASTRPWTSPAPSAPRPASMMNSSWKSSGNGKALWRRPPLRPRARWPCASRSSWARGRRVSRVAPPRALRPGRTHGQRTPIRLLAA